MLKTLSKIIICFNRLINMFLKDLLWIKKNVLRARKNDLLKNTAEFINKNYDV